MTQGSRPRLAAVNGTCGHEATRAFGRLGQDRDGLLDTAELANAIGRFFTRRAPRTSGTLIFGHV